MAHKLPAPSPTPQPAPPPNQTIVGTTGDDLLRAGLGNDTLIGGGGNDILIGGPGNDLIIGGTGNDQIYAGSGNSTLTGGGGGDTFNPNALASYNGTKLTEITDFDVSKSHLSLFQDGSDNAVVSGAAALTFVQFVDTANGALVQINNSGQPGGSFTTVAVLDGVKADTILPSSLTYEPF